MLIKNALFLFLIFLCLFASGQAQPYVKLSTFTTNEGLPSNHIYDIVEDNKGFLWLATDNGVSRFDGKYFQNFSVKNGLPCNDVLQVVNSNGSQEWSMMKWQTVLLNDSIIILGSICGLISLNINSLTTKPLQSEYDRTLSLVGLNHNVVYYIGSKGLYKYFYDKDSCGYIPLSGIYILEIEIDPEHKYVESNVKNNIFSMPIKIKKQY